MADETYHNDRELTDLESEIRRLSLGERPYERSSEMPDAAYWASFRSRVMQRIEPKPSAAKRLLEWASGHLLGTSLVGAAAAAAIAVSIFGLPSGNVSTTGLNPAPIAVTSPAPDSSRTAWAPAVKTPTIAEVNTQEAHTLHARAKRVQPNVRMKHASDDELLASATIESVVQPLLAAPEADYPVTLSDLSDTDLQFVYEGLTSLDSAE